MYRDLKKANELFTLEQLSSEKAQLILTEASKRYNYRNEVLANKANLKIQWDKQGKHLENHYNYILDRNKSILKHPDPQRLVNKFAGTGFKENNITPGMSGYKETVNFGEFIGYAIDEETG